MRVSINISERDKETDLVTARLWAVVSDGSEVLIEQHRRADGNALLAVLTDALPLLAASLGLDGEVKLELNRMPSYPKTDVRYERPR